jgi:hypothetical protein
MPQGSVGVRIDPSLLVTRELNTEQIGLSQGTEQNKREELLDVSTCV